MLEKGRGQETRRVFAGLHRLARLDHLDVRVYRLPMVHSVTVRILELPKMATPRCVAGGQADLGMQDFATAGRKLREFSWGRI